MGIYMSLLPFHESLKKFGFPDFIKNDEFIRRTTALEINPIYAEAYNVVRKEADIGLGIDYEEILAEFLNRLHDNVHLNMPEIMCQLIVASMPFNIRMVSISGILHDLRLLNATEDELRLVISAWESEERDWRKKATILFDIMYRRAEGGLMDDALYQKLRADLMRQPTLKSLVPECVVKNKDDRSFWAAIKQMFRSYAERHSYLQNVFEPLLTAAENIKNAPHIQLVDTAASNIDETYVHEIWTKALERMKEDPEAAITSARTLLETVLKHVLDSTSSEYDDTLDLPKLYKQAAGKLNLAPDQHAEQIFKQILNGCQMVVVALGSLRNKYGDAHGKGRLQMRPSERHAALAVNLAGSMCTFIIQTLDNVLDKTSPVRLGT